MRDINICIRNSEDAVKIVQIADSFNTDLDIVDGSFYIDARSILGICTIGFGKKVKLRVYDEKYYDSIYDSVKFLAYT